MHPAALVPLLFWPASQRAVHLDVRCPELPPVDSAALEVRARAELEALGGGHELDISCSERSATLRLKPYHQVERWIRVEVPGRAPGVDEILHALASLLLTPTRAEPDSGPPPSEEQAPPPPPSAAAPPPLPPPRAQPARRAPPAIPPAIEAPPTLVPSVEVPGSAREEPPSPTQPPPKSWRAAGGIAGQVWSKGTIALGPVAGVLTPLASVMFGYASTVAGSSLTAHALEGVVTYEYSPDFASFITASLGASITYLSVDPSATFSPNEKSAYFPGLYVGVFGEAPLSRRVQLRAGPVFSYFGSSTVIDLDGEEALKVGPWVAGAVTEVTVNL